MNHMKEVAALLGVQLNEEFGILCNGNYISQRKFYLTEKGLYTAGGNNYSELMIDLLTGKYQIQKIPFKPKKGDIYYTLFRSSTDGTLLVDKCEWCDWVNDYLNYYGGLCFRTKEEAEQNKDKVLKIIKYYEEN